KGETSLELDGFVQAALARCLPLREGLVRQAADNPALQGLRGIVVLPSYNGARKLPNLTALLAWTLARRGVGVLVHGVGSDPTRVTTAQVFAELGLPCVGNMTEIAAAWRQGLPAFIDIAALSPALGTLLA